MFKPSLKRSKLDEIQLYTKTYDPPHSDHANIKNARTTVIESTSFNVEENIIFPTSFFEEQTKPKTDPLIFNPLNYEWIDYPAEFKKEINSELEIDGIHNMGCYKELIWYFLGNILYLWHNKDRKVYKYKMHAETTCVDIGQIQSSSLHFKTRNLYIVAAGVTNQFFLFGIDKQTFAMSDLKFNYQFSNSRYIQKIKFIRDNEIVVGSDTSNFCLFDFTQQTKISSTKLPMIQRAMPYIPLLYPSSNNYIQEVLVTGDTFYVLVREEKPVSWFKQKAKAALNVLMMKNEEVRDIVQRKRIDVYVVNRADHAINLVHRITEDEFIRKFKSKHPQISEKRDPQALKIASIYLSKNGSNLLSIVTKCGYFITINQVDNLILASNLLKAPRENSIGVVGLYLQKREIEEESYSKQNRVSYSLGMDSLTLMNKSLWYFSQETLEPLKCDRAEGGDILDVKAGNSQDEWMVFTRAGYYRVTRLKTYEIFISYMLVRNELIFKSPQKSWTDQANFQLFVQNLAKLIGYQKICESLIDCLLCERTQFKVAQPILQMINDELRGHSNKNYRDWTYALSSTTPVATMKISEKVAAEMWKYLIEMQSKNPKRESEQLAAQNINCNAYWYALRNLFVKYSSPLLKVEARSIKSKITKIQSSIRLLETLNKFFFLKSQKELRYLSQAVVNRNNSLKKEKSLPRSPISKLKPVSFSEKKEEEIMESTVDQTMLTQHQNKFINQSSTKLEGIITRAIKKLKTLVTIFLYLADLNQTEQLGNIEQILRSRKERSLVRKHLQARVEDIQRLQEFSKVLPELELEKALQFSKWHNYQQKNKKPQMANLAEIARFISSEELQKIRSIFDGRFDCLTDLLLLYWDRLYNQMATINKREYLESKQRQIFASERGFLQNQTKEYICQEMKVVEAEVQVIITKTIKAYIGSTQDEYPKAEQMINDVIRILTSHDDKNLISFTENQMANFGLAEKLILLRKKKKKAIVPLTATDILTRRKYVDLKPKIERECLSNYEIYMLETAK